MVVQPAAKRHNAGPPGGTNTPPAPAAANDPNAMINELQERLEELTLRCHAQTQVIDDLRYGPNSICGSVDTRTRQPCRNVRSRCHLRFQGEHSDYRPSAPEQHERAQLCGSILTKSGKPCRNKRATCHLLRSGIHD